MKKAGDIINIYFDEMQQKQGQQYSEFKNSWLKITGDKIGRYSNIKDVIDGKLIIEIDHPALKQLILYKEKYIIRCLKRDFPDLKVDKIKFYFTNRSINKNKKHKNIIKPKLKLDENSVENTDFLKLLKKMSKRSEE